MTEKPFGQVIDAKAARKLKAQGNPTQGVWFGLGMMGLIGWSGRRGVRAVAR